MGGSPRARALEREARRQLSQVAKRYTKIKGENEWGCFLMGQNFNVRSRIKKHMTNGKYTNCLSYPSDFGLKAVQRILARVRRSPVNYKTVLSFFKIQNNYHLKNTPENIYI